MRINNLLDLPYINEKELMTLLSGHLNLKKDLWTSHLVYFGENDPMMPYAHLLVDAMLNYKPIAVGENFNQAYKVMSENSVLLEEALLKKALTDLMVSASVFELLTFKDKFRIFLSPREMDRYFKDRNLLTLVDILARLYERS